MVGVFEYLSQALPEFRGVAFALGQKGQEIVGLHLFRQRWITAVEDVPESFFREGKLLRSEVSMPQHLLNPKVICRRFLQRLNDGLHISGVEVALYLAVVEAASTGYSQKQGGLVINFLGHGNGAGRGVFILFSRFWP